MLKLSKTKSTIHSLAQDEADFLKTGVDYKGTAWDLSDGSIQGTTRLTKKNGDHSYYYKQEIAHKWITCHATMGFLSTDVANLSKPNHHVSTAYVVARNGTVFEMFDPKYWSYHIGGAPRGAGWQNKTLSQASIGIEISNFIMLKESPTDPNILTDFWGFKYCEKSDTEHYKQVSYRGYDYYATFTDAQYKALDSLLLRLCRRFNILHSFLPPSERFKFGKNIPKSGIWLHSNVRSDKYDMSPVFDFSRISGR